MAVTIRQMSDQLSRLRQRLEDGPVTSQQRKLERILIRSERRLAQELTMFRGLTTRNGHVVKSVENIRNAERVVERAQRVIQRELVKPGQAWADGMVDEMGKAGRLLARANLQTPWVSQTQLDAVFEHVPQGVGAVLRVGRNETYQIMETIGGDVQEWFRHTLLDAIVEELPLQGAGSLAERLAVSGRIKPLTIRAKNGRIVTRSVAARANAIARVECAKIINDVHETLVKKALGDEAVYVNDNPQDSRTTPICLEASRQPPMTLKEWSTSKWGRPPRLSPFHLCRSVLIGGREEWFDGEKVPQRRQR